MIKLSSSSAAVESFHLATHRGRKIAKVATARKFGGASLLDVAAGLRVQPPWIATSVFRITRLRQPLDEVVHLLQYLGLFRLEDIMPRVLPSDHSR